MTQRWQQVMYLPSAQRLEQISAWSVHARAWQKLASIGCFQELATLDQKRPKRYNRMPIDVVVWFVQDRNQHQTTSLVCWLQENQIPCVTWDIVRLNLKYFSGAMQNRPRGSMGFPESVGLAHISISLMTVILVPSILSKYSSRILDHSFFYVTPPPESRKY